MNNDARDTFPKIGDHDTVENVSGAPWPGAEMLPRDREITPPPPGKHLSPRVPVEIDAETGQALGENLAKGLTAAAPPSPVRRGRRPDWPERKADASAPLRPQPARQLPGTKRDRPGTRLDCEGSQVDDGRQCLQCGRSLENRRLDAVFCRQKCKR